jgi:hypothetical protein
VTTGAQPDMRKAAMPGPVLNDKVCKGAIWDKAGGNASECFLFWPWLWKHIQLLQESLARQVIRFLALVNSTMGLLSVLIGPRGEPGKHFLGHGDVPFAAQVGVAAMIAGMVISPVQSMPNSHQAKARWSKRSHSLLAVEQNKAMINPAGQAAGLPGRHLLPCHCRDGSI